MACVQESFGAVPKAAIAHSTITTKTCSKVWSGIGALVDAENTGLLFSCLDIDA
jgi:hypothetical protein